VGKEDMQNEDKTKEQLIEELKKAQQHMVELESRYRRFRSEELIEARNYVQSLIDSSLDMIISVDKNRRVSEFNKAAQATFGYTLEEVLGEHVDMLYKDPEEGIRVHRVVKETGKFIGEITNIRKDGDVFPSFLSASILKDTRDRFTGIMGISRDITETKRADEERKRLNFELAEKNKELEQLIYVASHDLRSPLLNIQGFAKELDYSIKKLHSILDDSGISQETMELSKIMEEEIPEAIQYVLTSVSKIDLLLSGLLRLSRLGSASLSIKKLDMNSIISDIIQTFQFQIRESEAEIIVDDLPSCFGDMEQINQLFSNLLDNAIKHLNPDRSGIIRIYGCKRNDEVFYCVEDNGVGVLPEHQDRIFEIFYRVNPTAYNGEGLGLTIARRILDRHNGKISMKSEHNKGSKFCISLPDIQGDI
jgi:PAS domain S-box-containing protein